MTLSIFVRPTMDNGYTAKVLGWPEIIVEGETKEEALDKIKSEIDLRLGEGEIIRLQYEPAKKEHAWMKFAGMWKNDPTFDDFLDEIRAYREELDKEWNQQQGSFASSELDCLFVQIPTNSLTSRSASRREMTNLLARALFI